MLAEGRVRAKEGHGKNLACPPATSMTGEIVRLTPRKSLKRELVFKLAKGYVGRNKNVFSVAKPRVTKALQKAYKDRKRKKREQRSIWIMQINAG